MESVTLEYETDPSMGSQSMTQTSTRTLTSTTRDGTPVWRIVEQSVSGTVEMQGQSTPVKQSFDRPVFAGDAHMEIALAALPLEEGDTAMLPVFDLQRQQVTEMQATVNGTATVEGPTGSVEAFVVEIDSEDGPSGTMHVQRESPHVVLQADLEVPSPQGTVTVERTLTSME